MNEETRSILIFGGSDLQLSIIGKCKKVGLYTVVIDPKSSALASTYADSFEVIAGDDFESTCSIVEKYKVAAIITAATDKPLVMMSKIADKYGFPFISEETAICSTDKYLMKQYFEKCHIPCAEGILVENVGEILNYPVILKPRDNSGSRGVVYCQDESHAKKAFDVAKSFTSKANILAEEVIEGKEYSVESLHFDKRTHIVQITEKTTSKYPYSVELGHIQPVDIHEATSLSIEKIVTELSNSLGFNNCAAHTELKINDNGIFILETSPRLGGDYITSKLVPLSTGISIEEMLVHIALGDRPPTMKYNNRSSGIFYFNLPSGYIHEMNNLDKILLHSAIVEYKFNLKFGDKIPLIRNSLDRYGYIILKAENRADLLKIHQEISDEFLKNIVIKDELIC